MSGSYTEGFTVTLESPTNTGGAVSYYSITPSLPTGMSFNTTTGIITGRPNGLSGSITYTVTGTNATGTATYNFTMQIVPPKALWIKIFLNNFRYVKCDSMNNYYGIYISINNNTPLDINGDGSVIIPGNSSGIQLSLVKINNMGVVVWAKTYKPISNTATPLIIDSSDNIYIAGGYSSAAIDFNGNGSVTVPLDATGQNFYLVKFNSSGVAQWARTYKFNGIGTIDIDSNNNIYVAGNYNSGSSTIVSGNGSSVSLPPAGRTAIVKYDSAGTPLTAKTIIYSLTFVGISVDSSGNIYVIGNNGNTAATTVIVDGVTLTPAAGSTKRNIFLIKYSSSFVLSWLKEIASVNTDDNVSDIEIDNSDNVYICGMYNTTAALNLNGDNSVVLPITGGGDAFLVKYDTSGVALWAKTYYATHTGDSMNSIAIDSDNNVLITGTYGSAASPVAISSTVSLPISNGYDSFIVKYSASGDYIWHKHIQGVGTENGQNIIIDNLENILLNCLLITTSTIDLNGDGTLVIPSSSGAINHCLIQYGKV